MRFYSKLDAPEKVKRDKLKKYIKTNNFCQKHFPVKPRPDYVLMYDLKRKMREKEQVLRDHCKIIGDLYRIAIKLLYLSVRLCR